MLGYVSLLSSSGGRRVDVFSTGAELVELEICVDDLDEEAVQSEEPVNEEAEGAKPVEANVFDGQSVDSPCVDNIPRPMPPGGCDSEPNHYGKELGTNIPVHLLRLT